MYMAENNYPLITSPEIRSYCEKHTSAPDPILDQLEEANSKLSMARMISGRYLGRFLSMISKTVAPKHILEIGTFTGYGALCLAEGLLESGKLITIEYNEEMAHYNRSYSEELGMENKIERIIGDAVEIIPQLEQTFDLVFIDAAKRKYITFYEMVLEKMPSGGVILADNTLWKGKVAESNEDIDKLGLGLMAFNEHVMADDRVENILLPIDDGVHFIRKK